MRRVYFGDCAKCGTEITCHVCASCGKKHTLAVPDLINICILLAERVEVLDARLRALEPNPFKGLGL